MAVAVIAGMSHRPLLTSRNRAEVLIEAMVAERVIERQQLLEETRINKMANAIAKRFG